MEENLFIDRQVYDISELQSENDYIKLKEYSMNEIINPNKIIGNKFVNYYTSIERLNTKGRRGISFFELFRNKDEYLKVESIARLIQIQLNSNPNANIYKVWYNIFKLYYGSLSIFKPIIAVDVYKQFKPKSILDFTMGWGGRLVGACVLDIPNYTGIDLNANLSNCYDEMISKIRKLGTNTNIQILFQDALTVDYSSMNYDMVFTSPPYYNIEIYNGMSKKTKNEWKENFYKPIFKKTWKYLSDEGYYILNVPIDIYHDVCIEIFGEAIDIIPMSNRKRKNNYGEFIYVWKKC